MHIGWHFDAKDGRSHDGEPDRGESPAETAMYASENAYATLIGGITTVQSLGAPVDKVVRNASAHGVLPLPRILTAINPIYDAKLTPGSCRAAAAHFR